MIQSSITANAISNAAHRAIHSAAFYTKKICVDSKVDTVFHTTVGAIQAHSYIALLAATIGIYCCRGQIKGLVTKVMQAACFLTTKTIESLQSVINLFKQNPTQDQPRTDGTDLPSLQTEN